MIALTATTHTLELVTSSAETVNWSLTYFQSASGKGEAVGSGQGSIAAATTTTVLSAPASGKEYKLNSLTVVNVGAASNTVTLQKDVSATNYVLFSAILAANEKVVYDGDFTVYDADGAIKSSGGGGGGVTDGDKGDITVSGGGATWTIDADTITDAKLRDSAATSVIGRASGTSGNPADIVAGADGDILRRASGVVGFGTVPAASVTGLAAVATSGSASDLGSGTLAGARLPQFTGGDVTTAAPGSVDLQIAANAVGTTEIANDAVTFAKMQNISNSRVIGRNTAAAGDPEEVSASQVLGFISDTHGAMLYRAAGAWAELTPGTSGRFLRTNGAAADPTWEAIVGLTDGDKGDVTVSASGATWTVDNDAITDAKLRNSAATSVIGRSAGTSGDPADIAASADGDILRRAAGALGFGTVPAASVTGLAAVATSGSASDLGSGTLAVARLPQFTGGDVTTSGAGSVDLQIAANAVGTTEIANDAVTYAKIQNVTDARLLGRSAGSAGDVQEITVASPVTLSGGALDFDESVTLGNNARVAVSRNSGATTGTRRRINFIEGTNVTLTVADDAGNEEVDVTINAASGGVSDGDKGDITVTASGATWTIDPDVVTNAKLADMAANTIKGNNTGGAANPIDLTVAQATAMLDVFTSVLKGLVPASGGGTTNFLRADGNWTSPGASSVTFLSKDISLGTTAQNSGVVSITDAAIGAGSKVHAWLAPGPYTDKGDRPDEAEFYNIQFTAYVTAASNADLYWTSPPHFSAIGNVTVHLLVG